MGRRIMTAAAKPALKREPVPGESSQSPHLNLRQESLKELFDRQAFPFAHNLSTLDLFTADSLRSLSEKFSGSPRDYFIAGSAASPETKFYAVPNGGHSPLEALENLDKVSCRILLKRPESHDARFRDLLQTLFGQVVDLLGGLGRERVERLESAILISSGSTTTPIHFDPEIGFFSQIEGEKFYHVYPPDSASEMEMERFYVRGRVDIGNVEFSGLDAQREQVFRLLPGMGFHQPQNSPHWVRTGDSRSVSYTFVFQTDISRARGRTRAFNYCLRQLGISPAHLGAHPAADALKARAMKAAIPLQLLGRVVNKTQRVLAGKRLS
jgi:hypothetical protein